MNQFLRGIRYYLALFVLLSLAACQNQNGPTATMVPTEPATVTAPTIIPTETPPSSLVICIAEEPLTLYAYGSDSKSMWSVLEAIYDGPIDSVNFTAQPVILNGLPNFENGSASYTEVVAKAGDLVVDAEGDVLPFVKGTKVLPAGCSQDDCAITWDGSSEVTLQQLNLTFSLLDGLLWSDGQPLTMSDSVYSFQLASDPDTPVNRYYVERTAAYMNEDDTTLRWVGIPGFITEDVSNLFWLPLPQHALQGKSAAQLLDDPMATHMPIGWGPYQIVDWVAGSHIELSRNPNYFRAAEGLPKFNTLVYQFQGVHADSNLKGLEIGECDVVDATVSLDEQLVDVVENSNLGKIKAYFGQGPEWEHLDFGITPASYDDGYQIGNDRVDWFGDVRMRQAFAYCSDRQSIANRYFVNRSSVPATFIPPTHPSYDADLSALPFDLNKGSALLDEMGWLDLDGDPNTPRISQGVTNVVDGTILSLDYVTTQSDLRVLVSNDIKHSLAGCGIEVNVRNIFPSELYAPGPGGVMFGRNFDLAQFTWQAGRQSPCFLYETSQIPNAENLWVGTNVSGYKNEAYDLACQTVLTKNGTSSTDIESANKEVQKIFNEELPVLPLYYQIKVAASRADFCGLEELDVSARSVLLHLEDFGYGSLCKLP